MNSLFENLLSPKLGLLVLMPLAAWFVAEGCTMRSANRPRRS